MTYGTLGNYRAKSAFANVSAVDFQTVLSFTPTTQIEIVGYNVDFAVLLDAAYRMQLTVGGVVVHAEKVTSNTNSWTPIRLSVPPDTEILVQIDHNEATPQDARATLNYEAL